MKFNEKIGALLLAFLLGLIALTSLGQGTLALAQVQNGTTVQVGVSCLNLQGNLGFGSNDFYTSGSVSNLQTFLASQGYFNSQYIGSGRFGPMTARAVAQFQASQGIRATGFVGPITRAAIAQITCGTVVVPPSTTAAKLYSVNPLSGPVGTTISVTGFGFTSNNTVLVDGLLAMRNVPINSSIAIACTTNPTCHGGINQTLVFTMPSSLSPNCPIGSYCAMYMKEVTPGAHTISIQNENGTSNTLNFTVTGGTNNQQLSITGLSAPASLSLGQQGTWTVTALSNGSGNLHYSVVWGDEATYTNSTIMAPQNTSTQSSGSFTHSYSRSGNYMPVFTVTDDFGHSVSASNGVVVTPLY